MDDLLFDFLLPLLAGSGREKDLRRILGGDVQPGEDDPPNDDDDQGNRET
jgi:hypothetical protein